MTIIFKCFLDCKNICHLQVQECIGAAVVAMGPYIVLSLVPIAFDEDWLTCSNSWLLPILDKYTYGAPLQLFLEHIVPLAKSVQNASDRGKLLDANNLFNCTHNPIPYPFPFIFSQERTET